jgi:hypothetical protein
MFKISQWCIRRSKIAVVIVTSPRKSVHSSNPLLEVMMIEVFSDIDETKQKNKLASVALSGIKPTSSTITSAAEFSNFSCLLLAVEICEVFRVTMSSSNVVKATE